MIAFAKAHKTALWTEFTIVVLSVMALALVQALGLVRVEEQAGWMLLFASLPWSIAATSLPGVLGMATIAVGLAINAVVVTILVCVVMSWWLRTLRYDNEPGPRDHTRR